MMKNINTKKSIPGQVAGNDTRHHYIKFQHNHQKNSYGKQSIQSEDS